MQTEQGKKLQQLREAKGMSITDLSHATVMLRTPVSYQAIRNIESGASGGAIETFKKLAKALGVSVNKLV